MTLFQTFSENPNITDSVTLASRKDKNLEDLLIKYNLLSLYEAFESNCITSEVIWDLKDEHLKEMGLTIGERLKYSKAKDEKMAKAAEGNP